MKKSFAYLSLVLLTVAVLSSCGRDRNDPGIQYSPEMYSSIPYEPFTQETDSFAPFKNRMNQQIPPEGTIARGKPAAYAIPNSEDEAVRHSPEVKNMINPLRRTPKVMEEGKVLYLRFCGACHGEKGAGNGLVANHEAINPSPYNGPPYNEYTAGEVYYAIMHGKGVMGSYASQLEYLDRWKVVHYVETLQGQEMAPEREFFTADLIDLEKFEKESRKAAGKEDGEYNEFYALQNVEFSVGGTDISTQGQTTLDIVADFMYANKAFVAQFEGHTDADGDTLANQTLSEERAQAVADYIVGKGISSNRVKTLGYGSSMPVARGEGADFKARNRRTEVKFSMNVK